MTGNKMTPGVPRRPSRSETASCSCSTPSSRSFLVAYLTATRIPTACTCLPATRCWPPSAAGLAALLLAPAGSLLALPRPSMSPTFAWLRRLAAGDGRAAGAQPALSPDSRRHARLRGARCREWLDRRPPPRSRSCTGRGRAHPGRDHRAHRGRGGAALAAAPRYRARPRPRSADLPEDTMRTPLVAVTATALTLRRGRCRARHR